MVNIQLYTLQVVYIYMMKYTIYCRLYSVCVYGGIDIIMYTIYIYNRHGGVQMNLSTRTP